MSLKIRGRVVMICALSGLTMSCGSNSSESNPTATTAVGVTTSVGDEVPLSTTTINPASLGMHGLRYCEILLLNLQSDGIHAEVFNTYPLNDCPQDDWSKLDTAAIALAENVPFVSTNGPRYWAVDSVIKSDMDEVFSKTFGGIEMNRYASVYIGTNVAELLLPYSTRAVNRKSAFTFNAGTTVYMLHDDQGRTYVMQSWSQQIDSLLSESDLSTLADRLQIPEGWSYDLKTLDREFVVETRAEDAQVLRDDLQNTYSLVATAP